MSNDDSLIRVGLITRPHGMGGEVIVKPLTDFPSRFQHLSSVTLIPVNGHKIFHAKISKVRQHGDFIIAKLEGIDSRASSLEIVNHEIAIDEKERVHLPEDNFYGYELVGLQVKRANGERVGEVKDVLSSPAQDLLVVETASGIESLIPLVSGIVIKISIAQGYVIISDLPGLIGSEDH